MSEHTSHHDQPESQVIVFEMTGEELRHHLALLGQGLRSLVEVSVEEVSDAAVCLAAEVPEDVHGAVLALDQEFKQF